MRALKFITGHVIFKLRYNQIYQLKTTLLREKNCSGDWEKLSQIRVLLLVEISQNFVAFSEYMNFNGN